MSALCETSTTCDLILSLDGDYGTVEQIILVEDAHQPMYNLTVDEVHTFAVGEGEWVVHNCDFNKVDYSDDFDLAYRVREVRRNLPTDRATDGNIAIFEYIKESAGDGTTIYDYAIHKNLPREQHAEIRILHQLQARGIDTSRVTRVYLELQPCTTSGNNCRKVLQNTLNTDAQVYYSFDYETSFHNRPDMPSVYSPHLQSEWMRFVQSKYDLVAGG